MKKKQMIIGIVLLILCVGGYFGVKAYNAYQEKKQEAEAMKPVDIAVSDVTGFSYVNNDSILEFVKEGEEWIYSGDTSKDMDEAAIEEMLATVCDITSTEKITAENLSDYGFDEPTNTITLDTAQGTTTVKIGMYNEMVSKYYLSINASTELYLIGSEIISGFDKSAEDLEAEEEVTADTPETTEE
jgi:hypothetical protein